MFRKSNLGKNEEKKKYAVVTLPVTIQLTPDIKVFPVSVPLEALDYTVKLPIRHFFSAPLTSTHSCTSTEIREESSPTFMEHASPKEQPISCC